MAEAELEKPNPILSEAPVFDLERAKYSRWLVNRVVGFDQFPTLKLALTLGLYNLPVESLNVDCAKMYFKRNTLLIQSEFNLSDPLNILPTIGIEVESPRKPYRKEADVLRYGIFFDEVGMPRNEVNKLEKPVDFWEFSPAPSYSAQVQARVLSELIKGGFIPSLRNSKDPQSIREHLDDKLVSMHINFAVPDQVAGKITQKLDSITELHFFGKVFALAFSSSERLQFRMQNDFLMQKETEETGKNSGKSDNRLEFKAMEVRDGSSFRALMEMQLLLPTVLDFVAGMRSPLAGIWHQMQSRVKFEFIRYSIDDKVITNKAKLAEILGETGVSLELRRLITASALTSRVLVARGY